MSLMLRFFLVRILDAKGRTEKYRRYFSSLKPAEKLTILMVLNDMVEKSGFIKPNDFFFEKISADNVRENAINKQGERVILDALEITSIVDPI